MCGRWFTPNPRTRHCQRTCGSGSCQHEQKLRTDAKWREKHPDYFVGRRLQARREELEKGGDGAAVRGPPAEMRRVPPDMAQEAFGVQGVVIIEFVVRLLYRAAQEAMHAQHAGISEKIDRVLKVVPQEAIDSRARGP